MQANRMSLGVIIILLGVFILLGKLGVISFVWSIFWPVFILAPGVLFHLFYFSRTMPAGVLIPGGILITYSLMFFYCGLFGWHSMSYLWPGFILGVAVGLYEYYMFSDEKPREAWIAAMILGVISIIFFGFSLLNSNGIYFIAALLILIGIIMIVRRPKSW